MVGDKLIRVHSIALEDAREELERLKKRQKGKPVKEDNINVNTMYKRKGVKIHPRDDVPSDGSVPDGDPLWKEKK